MVSFFYDLVLFVYLLCFLPKVYYDRVFRKKKRPALLQRLGFFLPDFSSSKSKKVIWVHGVSVGEIKAAKSLVQKIRDAYPSSTILISTTTETGQAEAKRSCPQADFFFYLPIDLSWVVKRVLKKYKPTLILFVESDFWFHLTKYAHKRKITLGVVSGKMSQKSATRFHKLTFFSKKRLFSYFDFIGVQNEEYRDRFIYAGAPLDKITITGNLKYDSQVVLASEDVLDTWKKVFHIAPQDFVMTLASTHDGEEEELFFALSDVMEKNPRIKLLFAPRHPERCRSVESLFRKQKQFPVGIFTEKEKIPKNARLLLIDTMGFLPICYQLSTLAIMGGSFSSKVGGHNILEPNFYSVPALFGPHMHAQKEMVRLVESYGSGEKVAIEELGDRIESLLKNREGLETMREGSKQLQKKLKQSLEESWKIISSTL